MLLTFHYVPQSHHNILCLPGWHLLDEFRKFLITHHSSHYLDFKKKISSVCQREMWSRYISIYTDLVTYLASNLLCSMEITIQIPIPVFKNKQRYTKKVHDQQQISSNGGACDDSLRHIFDLGSKMGMNGESVDGSCFSTTLHFCFFCPCSYHDYITDNQLLNVVSFFKGPTTATTKT